MKNWHVMITKIDILIFLLIVCFSIYQIGCLKRAELNVGVCMPCISKIEFKPNRMRCPCAGLFEFNLWNSHICMRLTHYIKKCRIIFIYYAYSF